MARPNISTIQVTLDEVLFTSALEDWEIEKKTHCYRVKSFNNPSSIAIVQMLDSLSSEDRDKLFLTLPKRRCLYLQKAVPAFFPQQEQQIVEKLVNKLRHLSMPYLPNHEKITEIWDQHEVLKKKHRFHANKIKHVLTRYLNGLDKDWNGYVFSKTEPNMVSFEKMISDFIITVDWDLRPWELFCGVNLCVHNLTIIVSNFTFFGGLGISSGPAWYADEVGALKAVDICSNHALKVAGLIEMGIRSFIQD